MDFPIFQADFFGNRLLIALIAIVHVIVNHSFAVGMMPLLAFMEWWAHRTGRADWDKLLYQILGVAFIVTTSVGALTGVGIWFSTSVVNPAAIGSLLRVFYWAWFSEWVVFVCEVGLILIYFLTWKRMAGARKSAHIRIGIALGLMSWLTMAIITAVLGFMMNPGSWPQQQDLLAGFLNPAYIPQLLFRTSAAMLMAGSLALALCTAFTRKRTALRTEAVRTFAGWSLFWTVPVCVWALVYYQAIPLEMMVNLPVAFGTQAWAGNYNLLLMSTLGVGLVGIVFNLWALLKPARAYSFVWIMPFLCVCLLVSQFERTRQFIRKPYVLAYYMYSNGVRPHESAYLVKTGLLANSVWTTTRTISAENRIQAGREVFLIACSRCHTLNGANSVTTNLSRLYPGQPWNPETIESYIRNIHGARAYMPPFPGNAAERAALAAYLSKLQTTSDRLPSNASIGRN
ncbi:MAG: cytochrome c [Acidobacteria bacterium]|nr:MAG: cytochrome c [Acidobacteriota bacterium]